MDDSFYLATISLFFDFFQQLQLGIIRPLGMFKEASIANLVSYEVFMIPFVTLMVLLVEASDKMLWISLIVSYVFANSFYFFMIWGRDLKGSKFENSLVIKT